MITFNGIPVIQVPDGEGLGCIQCCFQATEDVCLQVSMNEWTRKIEAEQFGGDCVENNAHYELDEKE